MSLHVDEFGSGSPLLLIHGWGMHGGLWGNVAQHLAKYFHVFVVDLPGHGHSSGKEKEVTSFKLDSIVDQLSARFTGPIAVCGWSLGGQIALRWAMRQPQQVSRLVLVASTPRFVQQPDWRCAMAAETLAEFDAALQKNYAQTLRRFLALQVRGSDQERDLLTKMRSELFSRGEPDLYALQGGLDILRDCDLRSALPGINQAALVITGERDTLTPPLAGQYLASNLPNARLTTIKGAAHAPFLSHPDEFLKSVVNFLHE
jgi:pimeloyl-[acyl-carrier protein] methyl ester esterase